MQKTGPNWLGLKIKIQLSKIVLVKRTRDQRSFQKTGSVPGAQVSVELLSVGREADTLAGD